MKDRVYEIARNRNDDRCQRALASMLYKFIDKKTGSGISVNERQAKELHKPVINNFKKEVTRDLKKISEQQN